jgi:micrococcal nuclease
VVKIYDGDTIEVLAKVWPGHQISVRVRIRGIDAPEIRSKCADERFAALNARDHLRKFIAGQPVLLTNIKGGKYFGRVLANVKTHAGHNIKTELLASGLVRPYHGKRRSGWC